MLTDLLFIACAVAAADYDPPGLPDSTSVSCVSREVMDDLYDPGGAIGLYNGDTDSIYIVVGLPDEYTQQVLAHEAGHAIDLHAGTAVAGVPAWYSATYGDMGIEEFARMYSRYVGMWPDWEEFPDRVRTAAEIQVLLDLGILPTLPATPRSLPAPAVQLLADGTVILADATEVTPEDVGLDPTLLREPVWEAPEDAPELVEAPTVTEAEYCAEHLDECNELLS